MIPCTIQTYQVVMIIKYLERDTAHVYWTNVIYDRVVVYSVYILTWNGIQPLDLASSISLPYISMSLSSVSKWLRNCKFPKLRNDLCWSSGMVLLPPIIPGHGSLKTNIFGNSHRVTNVSEINKTLCLLTVFRGWIYDSDLWIACANNTHNYVYN